MPSALNLKLLFLVGYRTPKGPVFLAYDGHRRYHVVWRGESVGHYGSPGLAAERLASGQVNVPSDGTRFGPFDIDPDLMNWLPAAAFVA